jgi:hypothetical protein
LLFTVVSVTSPHCSETPIPSSLAFGVLMCVVRMSTHPVSFVPVGALAVRELLESPRGLGALRIGRNSQEAGEDQRDDRAD